jgi:hypothetical protein
MTWNNGTNFVHVSRIRIAHVSTRYTLPPYGNTSSTQYIKPRVNHSSSPPLYTPVSLPLHSFLPSYRFVYFHVPGPRGFLGGNRKMQGQHGQFGVIAAAWPIAIYYSRFLSIARIHVVKPHTTCSLHTHDE